MKDEFKPKADELKKSLRNDPANKDASEEEIEDSISIISNSMSGNIHFNR